MAGDVPRTNYLSETEERLVDFDKLAPGFLREISKSDSSKMAVKSAPRIVVDLCKQFAAPRVYKNESDDPVNFMSDLDIEQSKRKKEQGNLCFKAQDYEAPSSSIRRR